MDKKEYIIDNPTLMSEWNFEKNDTLGLKPTTLTVGSHQKAWWICLKGHKWQVVIANRNRGRGCPYCSGRRKT